LRVQDKPSKCHNHVGSQAVAGCDGCGIPLCISCAVPVRGQVFGRECLPEDLKAELPPPQPSRVRQLPLPATGIGFAIAVSATLWPWKRYGLGSGLFGAWGMTPRWSILAGVAAVAGLALWAVCGLSRRWTGSRWVVTLRGLAIVVGVASLLHLLRRPGFGPHSVGPWISLAGAVVALVGTRAGRGLASRLGRS
jgi:hypothetical protein